MNKIKHYSAYMTYSKISLMEVKGIQALFTDQGLDVQVYENTIEFCFDGRDLGDNIVKIFIDVARILRKANGEVRCEIDDDNYDDPRFEFFTISNSKLWRQSGHIVRGSIEEVM